MTTLKSELVVSLTDKTGAGAKSAKKNIQELKRLQRDSSIDKYFADKAKRAQLQRAEMMAIGASTATYMATGAVAVGAVAAKAFTDYASLERRVNRVLVNAGKGVESIAPTISYLQKVGAETQIGYDAAVQGLETLVASGRTLEDSLKFLPSIAVTAQASGAAISDIGLSADALSGSMKITADRMQDAMDILVAGGKAGKFELKDMSQYLPSLLPAFAALGYEGEDGLKKIVAMLQTVRNQAGSSSEAATYLSNVVNKIYSKDTAKKFSDMGVDLPAALDKAKKSGRDVLEVFLELTNTATGGDLSKLPLLFTDAEMQKGVRALITQIPQLTKVYQELGNVSGSAMKDFKQITGDAQGSVERLSAAVEKLWTKMGKGAATAAVPIAEGVTQFLDDVEAEESGRQKVSGGDARFAKEDEGEFKKEWVKRHPNEGWLKAGGAYREALRRVGRDGDTTTMAEFIRQDRATAMKKHYQNGYIPATGKPSSNSAGNSGNIPIPAYKPGTPEAEADDRAQRAAGYKYGTGRELVPEAGEAVGIKESAEKLITESIQNATNQAMGLNQPWIEDEDRYNRAQPESPGWFGGLFGGKNSAAETQPSPLSSPADTSPKTVITQPSGVQQVQVMNQPTPNITVHAPITITNAADANSVAGQLASSIKTALSGVHADVEHVAGQ